MKIQNTNKKWCKWALVGVLGLILSWSVNASTLVEPGKFILSIKPGERVTNTITVRNESNRATLVKAVVYDWTLNDQDQMITSQLGSRKDSLNGLIKFNPRVFTLEPSGSQLVRFTLTAPKDASPGELRGIVYFEEESQVTDNGVNAKLVTQVGSTIYLGITPLKLQIRLLAAKTVLTSTGVSGVIKVRNEGPFHARYAINYKVINEKNELATEGETPEKILLPGFEREVSFPVEGEFPPGKYTLMLTMKFYNSEKTLTYSLPFTKPK